MSKRSGQLQKLCYAVLFLVICEEFDRYVRCVCMLIPRDVAGGVGTLIRHRVP